MRIFLDLAGSLIFIAANVLFFLDKIKPEGYSYAAYGYIPKMRQPYT